MRVAVTGASGFVGRRLVEALLARGDQVVALGRRPGDMHLPAAAERRRFDPNDAAPQPGAFEGADAVVHLAGESIAGRWTAAKKRAIADSRVAGTRCLVESLAAARAKPAVLVAASAVGFYGSRGDEPLFESAAPGGDFLADVCARWEAAADAARGLGVRTVLLRTGIVLGNGGALASMAPPFRLGLGGPFGSGRQFVPWIHLDDVVALYLFALDRPLAGAVNAVAPDYATSARFAQALGSAVARPALAPAPGIALHAVLGEFASTILASQLVIPAKAEDAGFAWSHPFLEEAMARALDSKLAPPYGISLFESAQTVAAKREDVFAFFSSPHNLEELTPPLLRFHVKRAPREVERGSSISYRLRLHGIPMAWKTLISCWQPARRFVDVQLHGPYALWRHEHRFRDVPAGTELVDRVHFVLPFAPLSKPAMAFVRSDVEKIFAFRRKAIAARFS
jgi:uncharacterized protein